MYIVSKYNCVTTCCHRILYIYLLSEQPRVNSQPAGCANLFKTVFRRRPNVSRRGARVTAADSDIIIYQLWYIPKGIKYYNIGACIGIAV